MKSDTVNTIRKQLRLRILEIIYRAHAYHIGSCISCVDIIYSVYRVKKPTDKFVLSSGHAAVALYVVLEHVGLLKNPSLTNMPMHPTRNPKSGIDVSTGSLGQGLPIAVGMALSNRTRQVYCLVSDGECSEGSIWEAFRVAAQQQLDNLTIIINANGWGSYDPIPTNLILRRLRGFMDNLTVTNGHDITALIQVLGKRKKGIPHCILAKTHYGRIPFLKGQDAHYHVMTESEFRAAPRYL